MRLCASLSRGVAAPLGCVKKQIKKTRKKEFMKDRLPELARKMQLLDISIDEVKEELEKNLKKIRI